MLLSLRLIALLPLLPSVHGGDWAQLDALLLLNFSPASPCPSLNSWVPLRERPLSYSHLFSLFSSKLQVCWFWNLTYLPCFLQVCHQLCWYFIQNIEEHPALFTWCSYIHFFSLGGQAKWSFSFLIMRLWFFKC